MQWFPLVVPHSPYICTLGISWSYIESNPSIFIEPDGSVTIYVRCVNFRKFRDDSYVVGDTYSDSKYYLLRGKYAENTLTITSTEPVTIHTTLPVYASPWKGYEDLRFMSKNMVLMCSPQHNPSGMPCTVKGACEGSYIIVDTLCEPVEAQKHWMPFENRLCVLHSVHPLTIKNFRTDDKTHICDLSELKDYYGGSNGVEIAKNTFLFLIHTKDERKQCVMSRWLCTHADEKYVSYSEPFKFVEHSFHEQVCSLSLHKGELFMGLGVNYDKAYFCKVAIPEIHTFASRVLY